MDIAALSVVMSQSSISSQVSIAVTKMSMDNAEQLSKSMTDMIKSMELSVNPHVGGSVDINA